MTSSRPSPRFTSSPCFKSIRWMREFLIEALSGRWSYEKDRRDQRNIWWHVANAFPLLIGRASPPAAPELPPVKILTRSRRVDCLSLYSGYGHEDSEAYGKTTN